MAAVTAPARRRSLIGLAVTASLERLRSRGRSPGRLAAAAAAARQHVVTVAALTAVDLGVFHYSAGAGWIAVGVSLLALDFAVTGY